MDSHPSTEFLESDQLFVNAPRDHSSITLGVISKVWDPAKAYFHFHCMTQAVVPMVSKEYTIVDLCGHSTGKKMGATKLPLAAAAASSSSPASSVPGPLPRSTRSSSAAVAAASIVSAPAPYTSTLSAAPECPPEVVVLSAPPLGTAFSFELIGNRNFIIKQEPGSSQSKVKATKVKMSMSMEEKEKDQAMRQPMAKSKVKNTARKSAAGVWPSTDIVEDRALWRRKEMALKMAEHRAERDDRKRAKLMREYIMLANAPLNWWGPVV